MKYSIIILLLFMGSLLAFDHYYFGLNCDINFCSSSLRQVLLHTFLLLSINVIFLIPLNFLPTRYFRMWWRFARFAIPTVFLSLILISQGALHSSTGGSFFNMDDGFDLLGTYILFTIFILGSVAQIIRGYYRKGRD